MTIFNALEQEAFESPPVFNNADQQIEAVAQLPTARQRFVSEMLDTILAQANS